MVMGLHFFLESISVSLEELFEDVVDHIADTARLSLRCQEHEFSRCGILQRQSQGFPQPVPRSDGHTLLPFQALKAMRMKRLHSRCFLTFQPIICIDPLFALTHYLH